MIDVATAAQLCMNVPNENKVSGISISYLGRGTQTADVVLIAAFLAAIVSIVLLVVVYAWHVRTLTSGNRGPLT